MIVATAGNPAKRAHLRALGITEIHDSRTLDFSKCAPVDVVLNSLTGPAIPAGLKTLKPGGLFLELGKAECGRVSRSTSCDAMCATRSWRSID